MSNTGLYAELIRSLVEKKSPSAEDISQIDSLEVAQALMPLLETSLSRQSMRSLSIEQAKALILKLDSYGVVVELSPFAASYVSLLPLIQGGLSAASIRAFMPEDPVFQGVDAGVYDGHQEELIQLISDKWQKREWSEDTTAGFVASYIRRYGFDEQISEVFYKHSQLRYADENLQTVLPYITERNVLEVYLRRGYQEVLSHEGFTEEGVLRYASRFGTAKQYEALIKNLREYSRFSALAETLAEAGQHLAPLLVGDATEEQKQELSELRREHRGYDYKVPVIEYESMINSYDVAYVKLNEFLVRAEARGNLERCEMLKEKIANADAYRRFQSYQQAVTKLLENAGA